jgi:hypothetical protein
MFLAGLIGCSQDFKAVFAAIYVHAGLVLSSFNSDAINAIALM